MTEAFAQKMLRKRTNFNVDTTLSMPEESFHVLFLHSGLAELTEGKLLIQELLLD